MRRRQVGIAGDVRDDQRPARRRRRSATAGSRPSSAAVTAYAAAHARCERGRSDQGPRAAPLTRAAGAPDQNSSSGTVPKTAEPGGDLGVVAHVGARAQHAAGADAGPPPTLTSPTRSTSPSTQ